MSLDPVNPKLKEATAEVKAILAKHNIAGMVVLCSGEQSEYLNYIAAPDGPSWSCLIWEPEGVRIRAKALRFYANKDHWEDDGVCRVILSSSIEEQDFGCEAREALKEAGLETEPRST